MEQKNISGDDGILFPAIVRQGSMVRAAEHRHAEWCRHRRITRRFVEEDVRPRRLARVLPKWVRRSRLSGNAHAPLFTSQERLRFSSERDQHRPNTEGQIAQQRPFRNAERQKGPAFFCAFTGAVHQ